MEIRFPHLDEEIDLTISRLLPDTVSIAAVGDIMMGTNFPNKSYLPKDSGRYLWNDVRSILADERTSHLETLKAQFLMKVVIKKNATTQNFAIYLDHQNT